MVAAESTEALGRAIADPSSFLTNAWLIAFLPAMAALFTLFLGKRTPGKGSVYGIAAVGASLVLSLGVLWTFVGGERGFYEASIPWFQIGQLHLEVGVYVDGLTAVMVVVVTSISLCVHIYSLGYMKGDVRFTWFYTVLSLFTSAMLVVVLANNLFQLLVGWEIMGVCSYLLIGHWWEDHVNSSSAIKAFITTRVGDVPFMFGIFVLISITGFTTSNIPAISDVVSHGGASVALVSAAALLLFGGTIGKSAQFPLHVWLPDAMAGPTPVSALIHAATMVAAGVYLVGRLFFVFTDADPVVLQIVGIVGGITMLGAALMAFVQDDIKRVLAYSTISQLAYMVAGMSMGPAGRTGAFFHLFTHAFFKALLFLGSGAVIHAVHTNNMSEMGGLRRKMPITFWTFLIGSLALAGVPPLAGFWSKDELLVVANEGGHDVLFVVLLLTALLTAFYMTRAVLMTFFGEFRGHGEPHEGPRTMTGVLVALATVTVFVGLLGAPQLGAVFGAVGLLRGDRRGVVRPVDRGGVDARGPDRDRRGLPALQHLSRARPVAFARTRVHVGLEQVLHRRLLLEGRRPAGPRRPFRRCLLERPAHHRRRRQRRRRVHQDARERGELVRPEGDRRCGERAGEPRRLHRRSVAVHPIGQRPAVRRLPVRGRRGAGRHLHEDMTGVRGLMERARTRERQPSRREGEGA